MSRTRWILLGIITVELIVGLVLLRRRLQEPTPPRPDVSIFDLVTADDLRTAAASCETPEQWATLGELYLAHGYFREGEACLRVAAERQPDDLDLAFRHGFALERIGRLDEANSKYRQAATGLQDPTTEAWHYHARTADIWYYAARNVMRLEQSSDAQRSAFGFSGSLPATDSENARRGIRDGGVDPFQNPESTAQALSTAHPLAFQPVSLLYRIAVQRGQRDEAVRIADHFGRQSGSLPMPFDVEFKRLNDVRNEFGLSRRKTELERLMRAGSSANLTRMDALSGLIESAEWTPTAADQRAEVEYRKGKLADAIAWLDEAITRDGPAWPILERLGDTHQEAGDANKALAVWDRAASLGTGPELKNLRHKLALAHEKAGRQDAANSYHALAAMSAGIEAFEAARVDRALTAFTEATRLNPRLAHAWFYLGECHRLSGRPDEARAAYEKCLQLDPDHGRALRGQQLLSK